MASNKIIWHKYIIALAIVTVVGLCGCANDDKPEQTSDNTPASSSTVSSSSDANSPSIPPENDGVSSSGASNTQFPDEDLKRNHIKVIEDDAYGTAVGKITNTASVVCRYVQVDVNFYDKTGNQVDSGMANTSNLAPGDTWNYSIPNTSKDAVLVKVIDVQSHP